jgi:hypothetical protein
LDFSHPKFSSIRGILKVLSGHTSRRMRRVIAASLAALTVATLGTWHTSPTSAERRANQSTSATIVNGPNESLVPLRLSDPGIAALLKVGDRVDIFSTSKDGRASLLAQNVQVAQTPASSRSTSLLSGSASGAIVVVAIDRSLAGQLAILGSTGELSLAIRAST